jgi:hypothetical protein
VCYDPWSLRDALTKFVGNPQLVTNECLPYGDTVDDSDTCTFKCKTSYPELAAGRWEFTQMKGFADVQVWGQR